MALHVVSGLFVPIASFVVAVQVKLASVAAIVYGNTNCSSSGRRRRL